MVFKGGGEWRNILLKVVESIFNMTPVQEQDKQKILTTISSKHRNNPESTALKDLIQQFDHLFFEVQQCIVFLIPSGAPFAFRRGELRCQLGSLVGAPSSARPSHPTIGHRHQCNLRL